MEWHRLSMVYTHVLRSSSYSVHFPPRTCITASPSQVLCFLYCGLRLKTVNMYFVKMGGENTIVPSNTGLHQGNSSPSLPCLPHSLYPTTVFCYYEVHLHLTFSCVHRWRPF